MQFTTSFELLHNSYSLINVTAEAGWM